MNYGLRLIKVLVGEDDNHKSEIINHKSKMNK